jgi:hypothetical protein
MLISEINDLSLSEWSDESENDKEHFKIIDREIEKLYPKASNMESGELGVNYTSIKALKIGLICRPQPTLDYGIDAHLEIKEKGQPTGRLIAAQIKNGKSYVTEKNDYFIFYGLYKHLLYWLRHSLPVIIVYVEEKSETEVNCYWVEVKKGKIKTLENSWKIKIPKSQRIDSANLEALKSVAPGKNPQEIRFNGLKMQKPYMDHLYNGGAIKFEFKDGKGGIESTLIIEDMAGVGTFSIKITELFPIELLIKGSTGYVFPWLMIELNEEDETDNVCVIPNSHEMKELTAPLEKEDLKDIELGNIEIFNTSLNQFGLSFLTVDSYLESGDSFKIYKKEGNKA